ncbi:hypothetical protein [Saccharopolyspora phatthalungensis]|uniref:Uncharacterized protein n=1 Tax=Saccharopolyspora phatthalungensis TaxID=664693 RepID=A0A840PXS3_9PSEU|nr:hypothetical protein [Saccharopolyspora phatthalungensis]MBB5152567.1 hypothetical protein [Saccharopolyspora phatthalungensis]
MPRRRSIRRELVVLAGWALRALFTGGRLAELGVIDEAALRATLARAADGLPVRLGRLDAVVGAEIWPRGRNSACGS